MPFCSLPVVISASAVLPGIKAASALLPFPPQVQLNGIAIQSEAPDSKVHFRDCSNSVVLSCC